MLSISAVTQSTELLIALACLPIFLAVFFRCMKNWRWGLMTVAVWFVIVDLIRKTMEGTKALLMVSDGLMLFVFCVFLLQYYFFRKRGVEKYIPQKVKLLLVGFSCIVIIQSLNPMIPDLILRIAGLRTYLFYIPTIMLGLFFLRSENDLKQLYIFLLFLSLPVILLSFYQVASDPTKLGVALVSMGHKVHSFGIYNVDLVPATFASSKRYGRFLFLVYPFLYGFSAYYNRSIIIHLGLFLLFMLAAVASGSKEIVVILILFHAMFWILTTKKKINKYATIFLILISAVVAWNTVLNFSSYNLTEENYRVRAILSNQKDWKYRIKTYLYGPFLYASREYKGSELFWGTGVGTYGSETALVANYVLPPIKNNTWIVRGSGDSGITKLLVELGVFGMIYFFITYFVILKLLWQSVKEIKNHRIYPMAVAVFFIPVGWLILFLKAHTVISDGMMSFGLWFSVGIILALRHYAVTGRFPVVDQRRFT